MSRQCGECTLCCKLIPVEEINKERGKWCKFAKSHKGCMVYHKPAFPLSCGVWTCLWQSGQIPEWAWPHKIHCVFDIAMETLSVTDNKTGKTEHLQAMQCWVDDKYPEAYRSKEARWIIEQAAQRGYPTIIRFVDPWKGLVIWAPPFFETWTEVPSEVRADSEHERKLGAVVELLKEEYKVRSGV